ncbi:MAG: CBS domain-containing protein [Candidatus Aureabacteria bacterium]|nr:CBS domain-containing protein [Candidatus Auribacterota bacterium]
MKLKDIIEKKSGNVVSIGSRNTVYEAAKLLRQHKIGALLVLGDDRKLAGIITERDILRECAEKVDELKTKLIKDAMSRDLIIGLLDDTVGYSMGIMTKNKMRHLPVMEKDRIVGIVSLGDLVKSQLEDIEFENRHLKEYIHGA